MQGRPAKPAVKISRFTQCVGIVASVLVLWLLAAQVAPRLHHFSCGHAHPGASVPTHACVITEFSQGQGFDQPTPLIVAPVPVNFGQVSPSLPELGVPAPHRLPPACGPPCGGFA